MVILRQPVRVAQHLQLAEKIAVFMRSYGVCQVPLLQPEVHLLELQPVEPPLVYVHFFRRVAFSQLTFLIERILGSDLVTKRQLSVSNISEDQDLTLPVSALAGTAERSFVELEGCLVASRGIEKPSPELGKELDSAETGEKGNEKDHIGEQRHRVSQIVDLVRLGRVGQFRQ